MSVHGLSARELRSAYGSRELSPVEVVRALAECREALAGALNAYVADDAEREIAAAEESERRHADGAAIGPLDGVPIAVKDLLDTADLPTAYGSRMFRGHRPGADAPVVAAARRAGAIVAGKTGTHEFAWGITNDNPHFGACRNPWDPRRVPGGSSGGSGAAVASGQAPLAFGTDTAGSVRIPAAFCGVVGFKPTYGLLPVGGIFALAPSLDHVGFLGREPGDVAELFGALLPGAGRRALVAGRREAAALDVRVGVLDLPGAPVPAGGIERALDAAAGVLERLGARVDAVALAGDDDRTDALRRIQAVEAFRVHHAAGLGGLEAMRRIRERAERLFDGVELLMTPVAACAPPPIGQTADLRDHVLPYTVVQSLTGLPACVVRAGFDGDGLPVGMQLTGPRFADADVLRAAAAFVEATAEIQDRRPPLAGGQAG
jgi:aspartyl-tRNA(Asn)/glutamyl-tRNA(Gln) amidotransferase subunit A